jgi:hypothetical protein
MAVSWSLFFALSGDDPDGGGACGFTDHRTEILAAFVLRPVGSVDEFIDRPSTPHERRFLDRYRGEYFFLAPLLPC